MKLLISLLPLLIFLIYPVDWVKLNDSNTDLGRLALAISLFLGVIYYVLIRTRAGHRGLNLFGMAIAVSITVTTGVMLYCIR